MKNRKHYTSEHSGNCNINTSNCSLFYHGTCICKGYLAFIFVFLPGFIYFLKSLLIRTKCMMIGHSGSSSFSKIYTSKISSVSLYLSTLMCGKLRCSALAHSSASINSLKWIWNCLEWHYFDKKYEIMGQII